ncbi:MAG TPA: hypothetical protein VN284_21510, partial [Rhizobium sp.]|nr:hypothetical protein [Rhizobium sp.]
DEVVLLVSLADESERLSVVGKVAWICPPGAQGNRTAGIGIHFNDSPSPPVARPAMTTRRWASLPVAPGKP